MTKRKNGPKTKPSRRRRAQGDEQQPSPMNGPAPLESHNHNPSKAHHGQGRADAKSGSMDIDTDAARGQQTGTQPDVMNASKNTPPNPNPPTSLPTIDTSSSAKNSDPTKTPTITLSPPHRENGPQFGSPLLLCQKAYEPSKPHPTQDLFSLFGLTPLAQGVARKDLTTGTKINIMRKTYAGQIKGFQLAGKNKAMPHSEGGAGMSLSEIVMWPEPEWQNQKVSGKDLSKGFSSGPLSKLEKAMKLEPGPVPKNDEWESMLGLEKVKHGPPTGDSKVKHPAGPAMKTTKHNGNINGAIKGPAESEVARPKRTNKKRRYNDEAFEGYGEGFDDDHVEEVGGYSSAEGSRRGSASKKRRKDYPPLNSPIGSGVGGYAAGLMGQQHVGRGIGAYGGR